MSTKTAYRTTMPFDGGLSPTTPKSTAVPLFGDTPNVQDIINGSPVSNDVHSRGWGDTPDDPHYRSDIDHFKIDNKIIEVMKRLKQRRKLPRHRWYVEDFDGKSAGFESLEAIQRRLREGMPMGRIRSVFAQNSETDAVGKALLSTVMVKSSARGEQTMELGAGFCVGDGVYVTCAHVIRRYNKYEMPKSSLDSSSVNITVEREGESGAAYLAALDYGLDLAIVVSDFKSVPMLIDASDIPQGEAVFAVGSPRGYENNVSSGIVSGKDRQVFGYDGAPLFTFTDANVLPGNSGGPLVRHSNGRAIGMMSLIVGAEGLYGLNAALPASYIAKFLKDNQAAIANKHHTGDTL